MKWREMAYDQSTWERLGEEAWLPRASEAIQQYEALRWAWRSGERGTAAGDVSCCVAPGNAWIPRRARRRGNAAGLRRQWT